MDATSPPRPATSRWLSWPLLIALFATPAILWALASPLFSVPDEPAHVVKAVATWHGQLTGEDSTGPGGHLTTTFQLPGVWARASSIAGCYTFAADVTADCSPPFAGSATTTGATSTAGHYPLLVYALVGWGGRLSEGPVGVYLMRIVDALLCGALLAAAVRALRLVIDPRLALAGVLVAATPMALFLAGSANPSGIEVAAAIAVWATLVAVVRWGDHHGAPVPRALVVQLVVVAAAMALSRPLSPAFLGLIAVLVAVSVPVATVRRVLRDRVVATGAVVVIVIAAVAVALVVSSGALVSTPGRIGVGTTNPALVIAGETSGYVLEMIGVVGWLDTQPPALTVFLWLGAVFGVVALGFVLGSRRAALGLALTLVATVAVPIVVQYPSATSQGLPWQGRYTLPVAVGIPILAVAMIDGGRSLGDWLAARVGIGLAAVTGVASVAMFAWALRRYATGAGGSLRIWSAPWQPPGGSILLVLAMASWAAATVAIAILARPGDRARLPDLATVDRRPAARAAGIAVTAD